MAKVIRINKIKKDRHIKSGEQFLDVECQIVDPQYVPKKIKNDSGDLVDNADGKTVPTVTDVRRFAYPLDTDAKEIKADLKRFVDNYNAEEERAEANREQDQADEAATKTITSLEGGIIK